MAVVNVDRFGIGTLAGASAGVAGEFNFSTMKPNPGVATFGRAKVPGVATFGRAPVPGQQVAAPVAKPLSAAPRGVSTTVTQAGRAAGYARAPADCGPMPAGAGPDATGTVRFSKDPAVTAWRNCQRASAVVASAPVAAPPYAAPAPAYEKASSSGSPYPYDYGGGGASSGGGGRVPAGPGELTKGFGSDVADDANKLANKIGVSTATLAIGGGVVLAAGLGLWLALR